MTTNPDQRSRARIAHVTANGAPDPVLTETCAKAGYRIQQTTAVDRADIGLIDLRGAPIGLQRASSIAEAIRRSSPEASLLFLVDPATEIREFASLRRLGDVASVDNAVEHVTRRIRDTLRLRNIAEEAGERLKTLTSVNRAINFPVIATDASPARVLIVGAPGPAAMDAIHAISGSVDYCACVLTAGQAMRAFDHRSFDVALFLPTEGDGTISALTRALRRHPKLGRTGLMQLGETPDDLASSARRGGCTDFLLRAHISSLLEQRLSALSRRVRLLNAMRGFLRACAGEGVRDKASGVFTPGFLGQHGARIANRATQSGRPLSVIVVRLADKSDGRRESERRALYQGARLLARITRAEDMAARIAPGLFAVLAPATSETDANRVAMRIDGVLSNTAFQRDSAGSPHALDIDVAVATHEDGASISETISAALRKLPKVNVATPPRLQSPR